MTIKRRILISHIVLFLVPVMMTLVIGAASLMGLAAFIRSGYHVAVESTAQFSNTAELASLAAFHWIDENPENPRNFDWLFQVLAPERNYIVIQRGDRIVYTYGDQTLQPMIGQIPDPASIAGAEGGYVHSEQGHNYYLYKRTIDGVPVYLYFVSELVPRGTDGTLEAVSRWVLIFIVICLFLFAAATSYFLTAFLLRKILPPLEELKSGAEQLQEGNLSIQLIHEKKDEFYPVFRAFNLMARKLEESLTERVRAEKARKELIASMSHDIRTPLTSIKAYVEGLQDGVARTEEDRKRYLEVIRKKTDELDSMLDQLFFLSKIDVGRQALPMEPIELFSFLQTFAEESRLAYDPSAAEIRTEGTEKAVIWGNRLLLERILSNLMTNSIKYHSGGKSRISMKLAVLEENAVITFADDGPGVPEASLARLFDLFYRTDAARSHPQNGSGLGLTIVLRSMALMGGTVKAGNLRPHGLCISLFFPLRKEGPHEGTDSDYRR